MTLRLAVSLRGGMITESTACGQANRHCRLASDFTCVMSNPYGRYPQRERYRGSLRCQIGTLDRGTAKVGIGNVDD